MAVHERADAARNRQAVIEAAARLFDAAEDPVAVSIDDIAAAAGVGKGTVFRRFGDRGSLIRAVFDARSSDLRSAIASGPPPLGPGTPPAERIPAVLDAVVAIKLQHRRLSLALENGTPGAGGPSLFTVPYYVEIHELLRQLLGDLVGAPHAVWTAHALLAVTRVDLIDHLLEHGHRAGDIRDELRYHVGRILASPPIPDPLATTPGPTLK